MAPVLIARALISNQYEPRAIMGSKGATNWVSISIYSADNVVIMTCTYGRYSACELA